MRSAHVAVVVDGAFASTLEEVGVQALDALLRVGAVTHLLVVAHHAGKGLGKREARGLRALLEDVVLVLVAVVGHVPVDHDGIHHVPVLHDVVERVSEVVVIVWRIVVHVRVTHDREGRDERTVRFLGDGRGVRKRHERGASLACRGGICRANCRESCCRCAGDGAGLEKRPSRETHGDPPCSVTLKSKV